MKNYFLLGIILLIFLLTRLYKITEIPGSVYWDEASIGYNAYAITTDLKDEWGEFLPLHFRAFGEFKLPVYIYSVAIFTKIFGLNALSVRLPSVLYSLGALLVIYLLISKITKNERIGLTSSFILAVSPWLFIFSRTGYEASSGLFFFLLFLYSLILYQEKRVFIFFAAAAAILSFYSYNSFRIITPLFIVLWAISQKHKNIKLELVALALFLVTLVPTVRLYLLDQGAFRYGAVGIKDASQFVKNYFSHFDYKFLFIEGDENLRSQQPGWGQLYLVELPLFLIGIINILKRKEKFYWLFIASLLFAPIPAALTRESPHALRSILSAPTFAVISSVGVWTLTYLFKKYRSFVILIVAVVYLAFSESYLVDFVTKYNEKTSSAWQIEYKKIFEKYKDKSQEKVVISDEYAQPYIFALYYLKYPPQEFRKTVKYNPPDEWGFSTVESFGNFEFKKL